MERQSKEVNRIIDESSVSVEISILKVKNSSLVHFTLDNPTDDTLDLRLGSVDETEHGEVGSAILK